MRWMCVSWCWQPSVALALVLVSEELECLYRVHTSGKIGCTSKHVGTTHCTSFMYLNYSSFIKLFYPHWLTEHNITGASNERLVAYIFISIVVCIPHHSSNTLFMKNSHLKQNCEQRGLQWCCIVMLHCLMTGMFIKPCFFTASFVANAWHRK